MVVIVVTVITQGFRVPPESRGDFKGLLFVNSGFFQAVGVISFGARLFSDLMKDCQLTLLIAFVCRMLEHLEHKLDES